MLEDPEAFFATARERIFHGELAQGQVDGINAILAAFDKALPKSDVRWPAYALATAYHETRGTMEPVKEYGEGRGHAYGLPEGPWKQVYYGRGDVQLTWEANYAHATRELRAHGLLTPDQDLEKTPDLACDPAIAAFIMAIGMSEGWFTGVKFSDCLAAKTDFVEARRIINGLDRAYLVAGYAYIFLASLQKGGWS